MQEVPIDSTGSAAGDDMKQTATAAILQALKEAGKPLAVHEFPIFGHSQTALSARTREMARLGLIAGQRREGKAFKEWFLSQRGMGEGVGINVAIKPTTPLAPILFTEEDSGQRCFV